MENNDYRTYILTNEQRPYFGLNPIEKSWERLDIKDGYTVYFNGNIIRKVISCSADNLTADINNTTYKINISYKEEDNEIETKNRETVIPRTKRGKEKKLNFTSISNQKPTGCVFMMNLSYDWPSGSEIQHHSSKVYAFNPRNSISLPIRARKDLSELSEFKTWVHEYISTCPANYLEKVERMTSTPHQTLKYRNGDIFRFEFDREYYGYALIVGQIRNMIKDNLVKENHALKNTMSVPLLIRCYLLKTKNKKLSVDDLVKNKLSSPFFMADGQVIWGGYPITGNKKLEPEDIEFPIQVGESLDWNSNYPPRFCWGSGIKEVNKDEVPEVIKDCGYLSHGVSSGISVETMEKLIENGDTGQPLMREENKNDKDIIFDFFDIPQDITFDEFNKKYNGMTREEYAEYANKK